MVFVRKCASVLDLAIIAILSLSSTVSSQTLCGNLALTAIGNDQNLTSPNYPSNYSSYANCRWNITAASYSDVVVLKLLDFYLQGSSPSCYYDYVTIYDGSSTQIQDLCGQVSPKQFISTGASMTVVFHSDSIDNYRGFKFEYISVNKSDLCNYTIFSSDGLWYVTSPGYPYSYTSNLNCQWLLTADSPSQVAMLYLLDFYMQGYFPSCNNDYVAIYDGNTTNSPLIRKLCDQVSSTQIVSSGMSLTLVFRSDSLLNYRGFKFESFLQNKSDLCANVSLTASTSANYFNSANYPGQYPSIMDCKYFIKADSASKVVVLDISAFSVDYSLSCTSDYVKIYDGPSNYYSSVIATLCGVYYYGTYKSTGSDMTVVFHSDGVSSGNTGFQFSYKSELPSSGIPGTIDFGGIPSPSSSKYLPGYVLGPVFVAVVGLIVGVCCRRRQYRATQVARRAQRVTTAPAPRPAPPPMPAPNITANQNANQANIFFVLFESNNQADSSTDTQSPQGTPGTQHSPQVPPEPPRYSTLSSDINASLPPYDPRYPDYRANNLPPAYSEVAGGASPYEQKHLPYDPKPDKSPFGLGSSSDEAGYANIGFSSDAATGPPTSSQSYTDPSAAVRDSVYNN